MNIVRLGRPSTITNFVNDQPFGYKSLPGAYALADYWTTTFSTGEADNTERIHVVQFGRVAGARYSKVTSYTDYRTTEASWYWDNENQILYIHFEHEHNPFTASYYFNYAEGYSDGDAVLYIDDIEYLPLVQYIPSLAQSASIIGYDQPSYINGSIVFNNAAQYGDETAPLDYMFTENLYGNGVELFYLDEDDITDDGKVSSAEESALVELAYLYVESFEFTPSQVTLNIQDPRKAEDIPIPENFYNITDYPDINESFIELIIPVAYGLIRELKCTPIDGDSGGAVTFKAAESLTDFGTIQVKIDDVWTTKTATASSLSTGQFTLSDADSRGADDVIYDCKLVDAIGTVITYASDVHKELNTTYLSTPYNSSFYDTAEWESEETGLETIGILLDEQLPMSEWNYRIQKGANILYRYEYTPTGLRTIRLRDNERDAAAFISNSIITNIDEVPVSSDPTNAVFASVKVKYGKSYDADQMLSVTNTDYYTSIVADYKTYAELLVVTYLTTSGHADARALLDAADYSEVRPNAQIVVYGSDQLEYKIYQFVTVCLAPGFSDVGDLSITGREYFGFKEALILGIDPNGNSKTNTLQVRLFDARELAYFVDENGSFLAFEDGKRFRVYTYTEGRT